MRLLAEERRDMADQYDFPLRGKKEWSSDVFGRTSYLEEANADLVETNRRLRLDIQRLERLAYLDPLTGLGNRRYFVSCLRIELRRAERHHSPLALILCDIDDFKICNDRYGHSAGDTVLIAVGETLRQFCRRGGDLAIRHGGDEFALILPDVQAKALRPICDALRHAIKSSRLGNECPERVTTSIGAALLHERAPCTAAAFVAAADRALYRAKRYAGKDCVKINMFKDDFSAVRFAR